MQYECFACGHRESPRVGYILSHVVSEKLFLIFENMYITSALGSDSFTLKVVPFFSSQFYGK